MRGNAKCIASEWKQYYHGADKYCGGPQKYFARMNRSSKNEATTTNFNGSEDIIKQMGEMSQDTPGEIIDFVESTIITLSKTINGQF